MPLVEGPDACAEAGMKSNIEAEIAAGRSPEQAAAIAHDVCRRTGRQKRHKSVVFVVKDASPLDKVRGTLLSGTPGAAFRDHYLRPLGLERKDVGVVTTEAFSGWTFDETDKVTVIALGREAAAEVAADWRLPHPAAVAKKGPPESLIRKLRSIQKTGLLAPSLDTEHPSGVACKNRAESHGTKPADSQVVDKSVPIIKADSAKQIVYAVVLDPYEVDTQGDWTSPAQVEETAHNWMRDSRVIGLEHTEKADAYPVETWIVPYPSEDEYRKAMAGIEHRAYLMPFGDSKVRSGAWIMGTKLGPREWNLYKSGEIDAYSIGAFGMRTPIQRQTMPTVLWIDLMPKEATAPTNQAPEVPNP